MSDECAAPRSLGDGWWRGGVIYQIYPRSFADSNGDGVGDLPGITARMDYIAALGVEGIWISPFFKSPMKDFGYDVADYRAVDPLFGRNEDFDELLSAARAHGLKVIIDLVLSHTSDQHSWFHDESKKDWYVWADPKNGAPPNNWVSLFGGSAWTYDERYRQYYLHNFLREQPDLNFHNPAVQQEMLDIARHWLERGVDGFRLDVVNFYFHDQALRDNPPRPAQMGKATQFEGDTPYSRQAHIYDKSQPENLEFIERFRALLDEYNAFCVGELGDDNPNERAREYTSGDQRLHTIYNPHLCGGTHKKLTAQTIRAPFEAFENTAPDSWPSWSFSNHDVVRAASRWCPQGDGFGHDPRLSQMLIALLGCLRGTAFLYQGEELGLPEARIPHEALQDPWAKETWPEWQGRDGCRTPMPWNSDMPDNTWLPVPAAHEALTVSAQENDAHSTLNFTRDFLARRSAHPALRHGEIEFIDTDDDMVLAFRRIDKDEILLCVFNLSGEEKKFEAQTLPAYGFEITDAR